MTPSELGAEIAGQLTVRVKDAFVSELRDLAKEAGLEKLKEQIGGKAAEGVEKLKSLFGRGALRPSLIYKPVKSGSRFAMKAARAS